MLKDYSSWKQKIDPAFPDIIQHILLSLNNNGLHSSSGWLEINPIFIGKFQRKGYDGWIKDYERKTIKDKIRLDLLRQKKIPLKERRGKQKDICKEITNMVVKLPSGSQKYYNNSFETIFSTKIRTDFFTSMSKDEWKEYIKDFYVDYFVLCIHSSFIDVKKMLANGEKIELRKTHEITTIAMNCYNSISLLVHQRPLSKLFSEGKDGDEKALFKLLQIDKTATDLDWARRMIRTAQLTGNEKFFKQMAKAIAKSPLDNRKIHAELQMVLLMCWQFGLYRLSDGELINLLETSHLRIQDNQEAFFKYVQRIRRVCKDHFIQFI